METIILAVVLGIAATTFMVCSSGKAKEENSNFVRKYLPNTEHCVAYSYGKDFREIQRYYIDTSKNVVHIFYGDYPFSKFSKAKSRLAKEITKCEIAFDNTLVHTTNRGSQFLGLAVGGLALGGVGAIVGGLSGATSSKKGKVGEAKITLYYNDAKNAIDVLFFQKNDYEPLNDIEKISSEFYAAILACMASGTVRKCPFCAEEIKKEAIVCKHCGRDIEPEPENESCEVVTPIEIEPTACPHCRASIPDGNLVCPSCFWRLPE